MKLTADWLTDPGPKSVIEMLSKDHRAYFVGGCVRNALLGAPVSDIDVATSARPHEVLELADRAGLRAIPTGIDHGTVTIVAENHPIEVTTFRRDVATDGRRATVAYAETPEEDAQRRDFTMNALYTDRDGEMLDPVGGIADLQARRVRFIGDPAARIREDFLRILRFFRFHAWYGDPGAGIDAEGLAACAELADGLDRLSAERIWHELKRLLAAPDPAPAVASMAASGVLARVLPGADPAALPVLVHNEQKLGLGPDPIRRLALIAPDTDPRSLRLSRDEARRLGTLARAASESEPPEVQGYRYGADTALDAALIRAARSGEEIDPDTPEKANEGAAQRLPVSAADFMPDLTGAALGEALRSAEERWIASGFRLGRADLLP